MLLRSSGEGFALAGFGRGAVAGLAVGAVRAEGSVEGTVEGSGAAAITTPVAGGVAEAIGGRSFRPGGRGTLSVAAGCTPVVVEALAFFM